MTSLKRNISTSLIGQAWANALGFLFVPLYLKFLGIEAYGLVGFYLTLISIISLMEFGLGASLNREMARYSAKGVKTQDQRDLLRTLEVICWGIALIAMVLIQGLSPIIAKHWLNPQGLSNHSVENALYLMGIGIAFTFPMNLYRSGLMGLQRIVSVNIVLVIYATVRSCGTVLVLWLYSPTIEAFFVWQAISNFFGAAIMAILLWYRLRLADSRARVRWNILLDIWRFSLGYLGNSVANATFNQTDKIIVSKFLSLKIFGYYMLAQTIANTLWFVVSPIAGSLFPLFSNLVAKKDRESLVLKYHQSCQLISVLIIPSALMLMFFSEEAVFAWTRNYDIASNTYLLIIIMVTGTLFKGLANIPSWMQLAYGWVRLSLITNAFLLLLLLLLFILLIPRYGVVGASIATAVVNAGFFITVPIMHFKILKRELKALIFLDIGAPLLGALGIVLLSRFIIKLPSEGLAIILYLAGIWFLALSTSFITSSHTRMLFLSYFKNSFIRNLF